MIKIIIFDFDGVISESVNIKTMAFAEMYKDYGDEVVKQVVAHHLSHGGVSRYEKFRIYHEELLGIEVSEKKILELAKIFSDLVLNKVVKAPYVKGAYEFITKYYNKYEMFIASATPDNEIKKIIKEKKLSKYFKQIFGSPKKKNSIVKEIISKNKYLSKNILYIGDAIEDYNAAVNNNNNFIARIYPENKEIFNNIDCRKVHDLRNFNTIIINDFIESAHEANSVGE